MNKPNEEDFSWWEGLWQKTISITDEWSKNFTETFENIELKEWISFKTATIEDINVLHALNKEVQNLHHKMFPKKFKPHNISDMSDFFKKFLEDTKSTIIIIFSDKNEAMGYIIYEDKQYKETGFTFAYRSLYIHHISVDNEFQGEGLGKKLIQRVIEKAKTLNIDCIELDVRSQNKTAKDFFINLWFKAFNEKMSLTV